METVTKFKVGDRVWFAGFPGRTLWCGARPEGYRGTIRRVFKCGDVVVKFDHHGAYRLPVADLTPAEVVA